MYIGTASWNLPKVYAENFPEDGTHLMRYSQNLNAVEINSSFYRDHKPATYKKWAESVPKDFRFSVKLSRLFTHTQALKVSSAELHAVLNGILELGNKLGVLLVQLPPSLGFDSKIAEDFFDKLRVVYGGPVAFEPRHKTWLTPPALELMRRFSLSKVVADPDPCPLPLEKNPLSQILYYRLHGSPEIYKSNYEMPELQKLQTQMQSLQEKTGALWCIFDNTTFGYATLNALQLKELTADFL